MILVVDSGSTKTDWIAIDNKGVVLFSTQTLGLNPQVLSSAILNERIINNFELYQNREKVTHLFFMVQAVGASPQERITKVFRGILPPELIVKKIPTLQCILQLPWELLPLYAFLGQVLTVPILMEKTSIKE